MELTNVIKDYEFIGKIEKYWDNKPAILEVYHHKMTGEIVYKTREGNLYDLNKKCVYLNLGGK